MSTNLSKHGNIMYDPSHMNTKEEIIASLTTPRQDKLNAMRWETFLSLGIPIEGKTIFEPGAGIGDQTEWLLRQGAKHVYVNDGRSGNLDVIRGRLGIDHQVTFVLGDLEHCLVYPEFQFKADLVFCWGVYYHLRESFPAFPIMKGLANIGETIVLDYLEGEDNEHHYGYDNPSVSFSGFAFRPRTETLMKALKYIWGYSYLPKKQLEWVDPVAPETRLIAVASHVSLDDNPNLITQ